MIKFKSSMIAEKQFYDILIQALNYYVELLVPIPLAAASAQRFKGSAINKDFFICQRKVSISKKQQRQTPEKKVVEDFLDKKP